jgi:predicted PurR-regulated permease PerM
MDTAAPTAPCAAVAPPTSEGPFVSPPHQYPSPGRIAAYVAAGVLVLAGFYALYLVRMVLFLFLVAVLLATAMEPLVLRLKRGPFSRSQGILIVYTGLMLILVAVGTLTVPVALREAGNFSESYPRILQDARGAIYGVDERLLGPAAEKAVEKVAGPTATQDDGSTAISVGLTVVEGMFAAVTVFVVAFYWLTERRQIKRAFTTLFAPHRRDTVAELWVDVERVLGSWVRGQLLLMTFIGVLATVGYVLMGLKYPLVLGLLAGLLEIVPLVGPWLGAVPAILVALTQDVRLALFVGVYLLVIQNVEANVLVPRVMQRAVGISPLTVILGLLVGAELGGVAGALVAVPVAAALQVIVQRLVLPDLPGVALEEEDEEAEAQLESTAPQRAA